MTNQVQLHDHYGKYIKSFNSDYDNYQADDWIIIDKKYYRVSKVIMDEDANIKLINAFITNYYLA